jgi:hypothetical protein
MPQTRVQKQTWLPASTPEYYSKLRHLIHVNPILQTVCLDNHAAICEILWKTDLNRFLCFPLQKPRCHLPK